jgi:hypothetical protein
MEMPIREIRSDTRLVRFVTLRTYEKAGGLVRRDFTGTGEIVYIQTISLLQQLALEKISKQVEKLSIHDSVAWAEARRDAEVARNERGARGEILYGTGARLAREVRLIRHDWVLLKLKCTRSERARYTIKQIESLADKAQTLQIEIQCSDHWSERILDGSNRVHANNRNEDGRQQKGGVGRARPFWQNGHFELNPNDELRPNTLGTLGAGD